MNIIFKPRSGDLFVVANYINLSLSCVAATYLNFTSYAGIQHPSFSRSIGKYRAQPGV
ncbi:MAG: hypothetical protein ACUVTX_09445 [Bacteroidales bacterium]